VREIARIIQPGGSLWISAANRYCIGPHPLTGVWAIGLLPAQLRAGLLKKLKGIDLLRYANMLSSGYLRALLRKHGFALRTIKPKQAMPHIQAGYSTLERGLLKLYRGVVRRSSMRAILVALGPAFTIICRKR
jgi:hypothetical protein